MGGSSSEATRRPPTHRVASSPCHGGDEEGCGDEEGGCHEEGCHEGWSDEGHEEGEEGGQRDEEGSHEESDEEGQGDRGGMRQRSGADVAGPVLGRSWRAVVVLLQGKARASWRTRVA